MMNILWKNPWLNLTLRVLVGAVFVYAGILKLQSPDSFADSIAGFQILPNAAISVLALGLPPFEVLIGLMLITGWKSRAAALAVLGLTAAFAFALGQAIARGLEVDCGCFGGGKPSPLKTWFSFGRDLLLLGAALGIYLHERAGVDHLRLKIPFIRFRQD